MEQTNEDIVGEIKTPALLDNERKQNRDHTSKISSVALLVEDILIENDMSWGDWGDIIQILNARTNIVYGQMKIKKINELYA